MRRRLLIPFLSAALLTGCGHYRPAPLDGAFLREELAAQRIDAALADSVTAEHPLLRPLAYDPTDGLSPQEAAVYAVLANPDLRALRTGRGVAQAELFAAGLLPDPQLAASADIPVHRGTGALVQTGLGLSLDLNPFLTRGSRKAAATAAGDQVALDIAWQEWQVAQRARLLVCRAAFLDREQEVAAAAEADLDSTRLFVEAAADSALVDYLVRTTAYSAYRSLRTSRLDLEDQRASCRHDLNRLLGLPPSADVPLQTDDIPFTDVPGEFAARNAAADSATVRAIRSLAGDDLADRLEAGRLDLRALRRGYDSQEAAVRVAVKRRFPRINLGVSRLRNDAGLLTLGPAVTLDLPFLDGNQGEVATARATRTQLRAEYVARLFAARAEIADALDAYDRAHRQLANAEAARTEARNLLDVCAAAARTGDIDLLTLSAARGDLAARELDVLQLRRRLAELSVGLETVSGRIFTANDLGNE